MDVHVANNNLDGTPYMSIRGELSSRNLQPLIFQTCLQRHRQLLINIYSHRKI